MDLGVMLVELSQNPKYCFLVSKTESHIKKVPTSLFIVMVPFYYEFQFGFITDSPKEFIFIRQVYNMNNPLQLCIGL